MKKLSETAGFRHLPMGDRLQSDNTNVIGKFTSLQILGCLLVGKLVPVDFVTGFGVVQSDQQGLFPNRYCTIGEGYLFMWLTNTRQQEAPRYGLPGKSEMLPGRISCNLFIALLRSFSTWKFAPRS